MSTLQEKFQARKPQILAFAAGLILGPMLSGVFGWQIRSETVRTMVNDAIEKQQVRLCEYQARSDVEKPDALEYSARLHLAERWAKMPWQQEADAEIVTQCSNRLADAV